MQQAPPESAFQGSQAQGSGLLQSRRSGGDPPPPSTRAPAGRPRKRERNEAVCDPVKQQRTDKSRSCAEERERSQKPEAPSLVGKDGGLCSVASVDRLVCLMTYEWNDSMQRPVDLMVSRTMLAKVVAATLELDCLFRFLKLGGLSVLDRWLQEVYMGRTPTEKEASVEGDRAAEDLLLALLGALERLPVDLVALKTCSIGKSVNYLRSHKHPDIQRRARKLVDTWKRRVESEMKQSGEARLSMDQSVCPQQPSAGSGGPNAHQEGHSEQPAPIEYTAVGRGKYASVASLCSSPESHSKASSTIIPPACSVDTSNKSPLIPLKPSNEGLRLAVESTPQPSNGFPQSSEDGRATSSACVLGPCNNHIRAARNTGSSRHSKSTTLSISNTSSVATALSGSVFVSKDHNEQGFVFDRSAHGANVSSAAEVCTLPCCSFFQKSSDNAAVYDPPSRSTLNSASSCVADCKEKALHTIKHNQLHEPVKAGIQLLASIAASESSTIDVKSPDSPSVKSMFLQRATTLPMESKIPVDIIMKNYNYQLSRAGGSPQEREHYDRNSSTVSSPSETSTHVDTCMCEQKGAATVYENTPSPADTASETSLPSALLSKDTGRKRGACISGSRKEHGKVQSSCEKKRLCLQATSVAEAVGESSIAEKVDCENRSNPTPKTVLDNLAAKRLSMERIRHTEDDSFDAARIVAVKVEQEAVNCKVILSRRASFDRNSSPCGDTVVASVSTDALTLVGSKQNSSRSASPSLNVPCSAINGNAKNSPLGTHAGSADANVYTLEPKQWTEVLASPIREDNKRPDFDLNEMLSGGEEGPVQASGPITKSWGPMQGFSLLASDAIPALPIVPMAPIAVVAAAKGPFMLQAISCCRPSTVELGWKGSAATSAFRPTQPRSSLPKSNLIVPKQSTHGKTVLDFDLNIADDSSACVDDKIGNADLGVKSSSVDVKVAALQAARASSVMSRKTCEPVRAAWDLNQVDEGAVESRIKRDFDLNNGPIVQDYDDVVLAAKHIRMKDPLPSTNTVASNRLPIHPLNPMTPILMPAFAMPNPDTPYAAGNAMPWMNGGPHDGLLQYNIFMQNSSGFASSGMACPPLPSMTAGPFQGIPYGFSSASMQGFSAPFGDTLGATQSAAVVFPPLASTEPLMASQSKPPYIMGMLADVVHQQGMGGFWNRPNFDLNAGPEGVDMNNAKDDRRHMFVMNEQMRARPQVVDMTAVLQREQEGCVGMPGSMQGVPLKQSVWH